MIDNEQKKTLVTGATGFIGSQLVHRLIAEGWDTHIIVRENSGYRLLEKNIKQITVHKHDGSSSSMMQILEKIKPAIVFHLASLFIVQHRPSDVRPLIDCNIAFATQLVEAMTAHGTRFLVNTGTSWQHYENISYNPVNLYAATKQAFETILTYYVETASLKIITLKLFDTYGPQDPRPKLFSLLRRVAYEQQPLSMSPGDQLIDLVYIDDVIDAFILAAERLMQDKVNRHENYAVSSNAPIKIKDLVSLYSRVVNRELAIEWGRRPYRTREVMVPWSLGIGLPGWLPKIGIEEGIRRTDCFDT